MKKILIVTGIAALLSFIPFVSVLFLFLLGPFSILIFFGPSFFLYALVTRIFYDPNKNAALPFKKRGIIFARSLCYAVILFTCLALALNIPTYYTVHKLRAEDAEVFAQSDKSEQLLSVQQSEVISKVSAEIKGARSVAILSSTVGMYAQKPRCGWLCRYLLLEKGIDLVIIGDPEQFGKSREVSTTAFRNCSTDKMDCIRPVAAYLDEAEYAIILNRNLETLSRGVDRDWNIFADTVQATRLEVYRSADKKFLHRKTFIYAMPLFVPFLVGNVALMGPAPINAVVRQKKYYNWERSQASASGSELKDMKTLFQEDGIDKEFLFEDSSALNFRFYNAVLNSKGQGDYSKNAIDLAFRSLKREHNGIELDQLIERLKLDPRIDYSEDAGFSAVIRDWL